jgi:hypothetical protein
MKRLFKRTINSRQGMHNNHIFLCPGKNSVVHSICILNLQPLRLVVESLLLHPSNIQDIRVVQHLVERLTDRDRNSRLPGSRYDAGRHGEGTRSNKVQSNRVEAQQGHQTVNRSSVFEVTKECNGAPVNGTQLRTDCVDIQQCL